MSKYGVISGPYFPAFGLNTEIYGVEYGPEITPYFSRSALIAKLMASPVVLSYM